MANKENLTFETAAARLEEIVRLLEGGKSSLDESLKLYEEGVSLVRICQEAIDGAERRIKVLTANENGELVEKDFTEGIANV